MIDRLDRLRRRFRRVPFIPQLEVVECGAAALTMVMAWHGREHDLQEVREACGVSRDGASALDIVEAAKRYGFATDPVRATVDDLDLLQLPAILYWEGRHFVVLERVTTTTASIVDPQSGAVTMPLSQVRAHFSGIALQFTPTAEAARGERTRSQLPKTLLRPVARNLVQAAVISALLQPFAILLPVLMQVVVDRIAVTRNMQLVTMVAAIIVSAIAARAVLSFARSVILQNVQAVTDARMMGAFVQHLFSLPLKFFQARRPGDLLYRMQSNAAVRELLAGVIVSSVFDVFLVAGYLALLFLYDVRAALLIGLFVAVRAAVVQVARARNRRVIHSELSAAAAEAEALSEAFAAFETVRATRSEERVAEQWTDRAVERWNWMGRRRLIEIDGESMLMLVEGLAIASLIVYAGTRVTGGEMTIGAFALLLMLQTLIRQPLDGLLAAAQQWQLVSNHLARIDDVMRATPERPAGKRIELRGALAIENASFRYSPRAAWAVREASLRIAPGEKVAIAGRTGEGKSTIGRLLLGLHSPQEGAIRFDGDDLRELDLTHVRGQIGVVAQEPFLFNDTVAYNITLGDPDIDDAMMREGARIACIDHVIARLSSGYDTVIGENGAMLSGGERQRLAIARAVARRPRILLLDEATSALDVETEARLHENLASMECTRIVIAHRPQAIADADRVITVDRGRIVSDVYTALEVAG